jgi:NitT/TauT family transport system ATP-binding protein
MQEEIIAAVLGGRLRFGFGAEVRDPDYLYFHRHAANAPREADGLWAYAQMVRWGQLAPSERAEKAAAKVFAPALYRASVPGASVEVTAPSPPFDHKEFPSSDVSAYLRQFELHTPFEDALAV